MPEEILLTQDGFEKLKEELDILIGVKRTEVAERLKEAISYGDLSENSEYDSAKNEQAELEIKINKIENTIRKARILNEDEISSDKVNVGLIVKIQDVDSGEESEYSIVGATEADPFEGKISNESLVGMNLMGKAVGDQVEIAVPDGNITYKVMEIRK